MKVPTIKSSKISAFDPSAERHGTERDSAGRTVHVHDSGAKVEIVGDRKITHIRPDGTTVKE